MKLKAFPRISFQIQVKGDTEMNYRIVEEIGSTVIGKSVTIHKDAYKEIPEFVEGIWRNGVHDQINELVGRPAGSLLYGYYFNFDEDGSKQYLMGAELPTRKQIPDEFSILHVPYQTYAVFDSRETIPDDTDIGLEILNTWQRIYSEWFPSVSFEQVEGPCIEKYYWVDDTHQESICEVWIPVKKNSAV